MLVHVGTYWSNLWVLAQKRTHVKRGCWKKCRWETTWHGCQTDGVYSNSKFDPHNMQWLVLLSSKRLCFVDIYLTKREAIIYTYYIIHIYKLYTSWLSTKKNDMTVSHVPGMAMRLRICRNVQSPKIGNSPTTRLQQLWWRLGPQKFQQEIPFMSLTQGPKKTTSMFWSMWPHSRDVSTEDWQQGTDLKPPLEVGLMGGYSHETMTRTNE